MNEKNLKPGNNLTPEEAQRFGRIGGRKSAETRRKKKARKEWSSIIGSLPIADLKNDAVIAPIIEKLEKAGILTEDQCWDAVEVARMHREAMEGNVAAFRALGDLDGDFKTVTESTVSLEVDKPSREDLIKLMDKDAD